MVTEQLIRKQFIHQVVRRDLDVIFTTQAIALQQAFPGRASRTLSLLSRRNYQFTGSGLDLTYKMNVPVNIRLFDIWRRDEKLLLYNRSVWGVLYRETMSTLRYGFTKDIRDSVRNRLEKMNPGKTLPPQ